MFVALLPKVVSIRTRCCFNYSENFPSNVTAIHLNRNRYSNKARKLFYIKATLDLYKAEHERESNPFGPAINSIFGFIWKNKIYSCLEKVNMLRIIHLIILSYVMKPFSMEDMDSVNQLTRKIQNSLQGKHLEIIVVRSNQIDLKYGNLLYCK